MKEKPILFSSPMIRAILNDSKFQTRRVIKLPPAPNHLGSWEQTEIDTTGCFHIVRNHKVPCDPQKTIGIWHTRTGVCIESPYQKGGRLWVRETWAQDLDCEVFYAADHLSKPSTIEKWRPSIFMPRSISRINLEIVSVRVERLQEISEEDARSEGVFSSIDIQPGDGWSFVMTKDGPVSYRKAYADLWDSINGEKYPWSSNPWVWVIEFRRVI